MKIRVDSSRELKRGWLLAPAFAMLWLCLAASPLHALEESTLPPSAVTTEEAPSGQETAPPGTAPHHAGEFSYTVRSGDSLGSIAESFGIEASDVARANRLSLDTTLMVGQVLRIPNPFAAQMRELNAENQKLNDQVSSLQKRADDAVAAQNNFKASVAQLTDSNRELTREVRMLPWWRDAIYTAAIIVLLMLGVAALAIVEWFLLRRRFVLLAEMNESLRRLDQRYKAILAKAELRMQELYGRRRRGLADDDERPKLPEETELERLDHELHDVLEHHLEQLGGPMKPRRRGRLREEFGSVGSPVEARSARR
jgi:LysM repeat protein